MAYTGDYPAGLYDYEERYFASLSERQKAFLAQNTQYFDKAGNQYV